MTTRLLHALFELAPLAPIGMISTSHCPMVSYPFIKNDNEIYIMFSEEIKSWTPEMRAYWGLNADLEQAEKTAESAVELVLAGEPCMTFNSIQVAMPLPPPMPLPPSMPLPPMPLLPMPMPFMLPMSPLPPMPPIIMPVPLHIIHHPNQIHHSNRTTVTISSTYGVVKATHRGGATYYKKI